MPTSDNATYVEQVWWPLGPPLGPPRWQDVHHDPLRPCDVAIHVAQNGLCQCRGLHDLHPFHRGSYTGQFWPVEKEYEGRHRRD